MVREMAVAYADSAGAAQLPLQAAFELSGVHGILWHVQLDQPNDGQEGRDD